MNQAAKVILYVSIGTIVVSEIPGTLEEKDHPHVHTDLDVNMDHGVASFTATGTSAAPSDGFRWKNGPDRPSK